MQRQTRTKDGCKHNFVVNHLHLGITQRRAYHARRIVQRLRDFVGHNLAHALQIAAETHRIFLHLDVAQLGEILVYQRRLVV